MNECIDFFLIHQLLKSKNDVAIPIDFDYVFKFSVDDDSDCVAQNGVEF